MEWFETPTTPKKRSAEPIRRLNLVRSTFDGRPGATLKGLRACQIHRLGRASCPASPTINAWRVGEARSILIDDFVGRRTVALSSKSVSGEDHEWDGTFVKFCD